MKKLEIISMIITLTLIGLSIPFLKKKIDNIQEVKRFDQIENILIHKSQRK